MVEQSKTVLIVDDHPLFREGLKALIGHDGSCQVVGEAGRASEGLQMARELRPDLAVIDISLPDQSGLQLTRDIKTLLPHIEIMIVTMHSKIDYISEAFNAGAIGYLVKESATEKLLECLKAISNGEYFLDTSLSQKVVSKLVNSSARTSKTVDARYETLTHREQQVLHLLVEGHSAKKIAEKLFISPKTVENHRTNIMNKLDIHSTMQLVRYAAKLGLIDVDRWKE